MGRIKRPTEAWRPKSNANWNAMSYVERYEWIRSLTDEQLLEQAGVRAMGARRTTAEMLDAWCVNGMIDYDRKVALKQRLVGLAA
jgi:hypothetical protein